MSEPVPPPMEPQQPPLVITYDDILRYVQHYLSSFMHGDLKPWVEKQNFNYSMVVNLKNGHISRPVPRLLQKIMSELGFDLQAKRVRRGTHYVIKFVLYDLDQIKVYLSKTLD